MVKKTLTKRNEEFIFQLKKQLAEHSDKFGSEKSDEIIKNAKEQLLLGQGTGKTAQQIFGGTAREYVEELVHPKKATRQKTKKVQRAKDKTLFDYPLTTLAIDTTLSVFSFFAAFFGVMQLLASKSTAQMGITSLILISILAGILYTVLIVSTTKNPKSDSKPKVLRTIFLLIATMVLWIFGFLLIGLIPSIINPQINGWFYIALAIGVYFLAEQFRIKQDLPKSVIPISILANQTRAANAQAPVKKAPTKKQSKKEKK